VPYIDEEGHIAGIVGISVDITALKQAHLDLETAHETLETLIAERTAELHAANQKLQDEIGERQQTERTLRDERNLLHTLIDSLLDEVYVKDRQSRFLIVNKAATRIVNVPSPDDMIGKTDFDFYPPELAQKYYDDEQRVMATGQPIINQEEHFIHHTSGKEGWMLTTKIPLHNVDGEISGLIGVGRDITRRKTPELQALQWMIDQERVSLTREFIKNISHDVKSPLTVIRNNLYLLEHLQDDSEEYKTKVNIVRQQADLLERYIKDILTISRLDQQEDIDRQPVDLSHIINDILERYRPVAAHKHIQLSIDLAALPTIDVDQIELRRALVNIVENAITYTQPHGTIAISASFAAGYVTITVADTGIGIPTGDLDKIFRRFYRVDKARNTELGGTGLGLAIAQTIINMHNGLIEVESELGVGTTFHVKLPVNPASSEHNTDHNLAAE
jgi:PAS domain S-box-containing protein